MVFMHKYLHGSKIWCWDTQCMLNYPLLLPRPSEGGLACTNDASRCDIALHQRCYRTCQKRCHVLPLQGMHALESAHVWGHNLIMPPFLLQIFLFQIFLLWMKTRLEREFQIFFCVGGYLYSEGVLVREGLSCESSGRCALKIEAIDPEFQQFVQMVHHHSFGTGIHWVRINKCGRRVQVTIMLKRHIRFFTLLGDFQFHTLLS